MDFLGSAAFSKAVQALDTKTGMLVCLKIIKVGLLAMLIHLVCTNSCCACNVVDGMLSTRAGLAEQPFISCRPCSRYPAPHACQ